MKRAAGIILVYDVTQRAQFEGIQELSQQIKANDDNGKEIIIVANKTDLGEW